MNKITTSGLDLAKQVFHVVGCNPRGKILAKKRLIRRHVLSYFAQQPVSLVGMEGCAGAHYWARELTKLGHSVRIISPQHVQPYVRGNKNDYNDALAIAEAAAHPEIRAVPLKSVEQQDLQALHRLRERCIGNRTALANQLRGLLAEYGLVYPQGISVIRRTIPEILEGHETGLSELFRELLAEGYQQLLELDAHIKYYDRQVAHLSRQSEACHRLQTIPGYGPLIASAFYSAVGDGSVYRRGRDVSASLGLVPRQHSTGGKPLLLGISKRGDRYLRSLLIHGARSVVSHAEGKSDRLSLWVNRLRAKKGFNKTAVALANKLARIGWAVLAKQTTYQAA